MAFDWATQRELWTGTLSVKTLGVPGGNSPVSIRIEWAGATLTFVDVLRRKAQITETVQGPETSVSKADGAANAYILPWRSNYAVKTRIEAAHNMFVTPQLNGCAIFIGGDETNPWVIHANAQPDSIAAGMPAYNPQRGLESIAAINAFDLNTRLPRWDEFYRGLAQKMITLGLVPARNFGTLLPGVYTPNGTAAVFGARGGGGWKFYWNQNRVTTQFWPA